ncbi:hypothetical protein KHO57_gp170 [Mycobacterium phage Phabba]|uniref:Uncharacterized protein n=1 Tax=Mycobacterium phage Phabba TaxID=2027899 RepID=A0A249XU30_9CAUD|nr:hypothetical protein KHO57_gp170 [Mycobacterium phage Phabba]ASZ74734.1 hypothetical protein SEA_PHABBA_195 [Mycobacterium phage Phabba]
MAFTDIDPLEEDMKVRVEEMTPDQLVVYLKDWQEAVNGVSMALDGKELYMMRWLQKVYGDDAGRIVKWVCYKHRGKNDLGNLIVHRMFCTKMKWWVDKMHQEMQATVRREQNRKTPRQQLAASGFATSL